MNRVVVTGLGPVSSIGIGIGDFGEALRRGVSGIAPIASFDTTGFPHAHAGEVKGFRPEEHLRRIDPRGWGRAGQYAAAAARLALADGGLDLDDLDQADRRRVGTVVGTVGGEAPVLEELVAQEVAAGDMTAMSPELLRQVPTCRLSHAVSAELRLEGESLTVGTACSASNYALGYAFDLLADGEADVMLAGGADTTCRWALAGFERLGSLADAACSPFDRDRQGLLVGEGGAMVMLETLDHALARGARPYVEVIGYGLNCDADHPVSPNADRIAACMRLSHERAGIKADEVDYICAHGTGTPANDAAEGRATREVFGEHPPPISSIKSMLGHAMGAASALGAMACTLAITEGFLPPTINADTLDPDLSGLDVVPNHARPATVRIAQNNGFAFGGNNAIVIFKEMT